MDNILNAFCKKFCKIIEKYTEYIVVSGFVAIASGRVRGTEDIDMIISRITKEQFQRLHQDLVGQGFICMQADKYQEVYSYLQDNISVRYTYPDRPIPQMEIKFVKDPLDEYQLKTKVKLSLTGLDIWFSSLEMNIAFKEELLKSQKDIEDAQFLRKVYSRQISESEIQKIKEMIQRYR